jgi:hypothetical protein
MESIQGFAIKRHTMGDLNKWLKARPRFTPDDERLYLVDPEIIRFTTDVLRHYGRQKMEGVVYWAGVISSDHSHICCAVAPKAKTERFNFVVDHEANEEFVSFVNDHSVQYISQVHSHPGLWVDHSGTDDRNAAFRCEGLVSVVVPSYSKKGMMPLYHCGIHRYTEGEFIRLSDPYVLRHFKVEKLTQNEILLKDFR